MRPPRHHRVARIACPSRASADISWSDFAEPGLRNRTTKPTSAQRMQPKFVINFGCKLTVYSGRALSAWFAPMSSPLLMFFRHAAGGRMSANHIAPTPNASCSRSLGIVLDRDWPTGTVTPLRHHGQTMTRAAAVSRAEAYFDSGAFKTDLARRVADPDRESESGAERGACALSLKRNGACAGEARVHMPDADPSPRQGPVPVRRTDRRPVASDRLRLRPW